MKIFFFFMFLFLFFFFLLFVSVEFYCRLFTFMHVVWHLQLKSLDKISSWHFLRCLLFFRNDYLGNALLKFV